MEKQKKDNDEQTKADPVEDVPWFLQEDPEFLFDNWEVLDENQI